MHIMCDFNGTLCRDGELDSELVDVLINLKNQGKAEVSFVTLEPGMSGLAFDLACREDQLGEVRFQSRRDLSENQKQPDILIDDEAEKNMREYGIAAREVLDPETAASTLAERFPDCGAKTGEPAPL